VQVCEVVTGEGSVMALTEDGQVYSWGRNLGHCLGHSPEGSGSEKAQPILLPKRVEALAGARVRSVELTSTAGFAVLDEGQLYSWGSELSQCDVLGGHAGLELPCGRLSPCVVPRRVEALQGTRMRRVVATRQHALGVSADGAVFSWGVFGFYAWGYFGYALGLGKDPLHFSHSANRRRMAHQAPTQIEGVRVRV
jgi:alpha-tubulin suppressor-like RCC1 family protein